MYILVNILKNSELYLLKDFFFIIYCFRYMKGLNRWAWAREHCGDVPA